ncbi:unnamed protein product [Symbiodinium natans]|uniref:Uncharacterized protein n=1 Tax=Symbiodinium natans TaxID=878477 RepID=A0A812RGL1_9DINO|nr:unnamed protein product [Symbiodinium natans]
MIKQGEGGIRYESAQHCQNLWPGPGVIEGLEACFDVSWGLRWPAETFEVKWTSASLAAAETSGLAILRSRSRCSESNIIRARHAICKAGVCIQSSTNDCSSSDAQIRVEGASSVAAKARVLSMFR